MEELVEFTHKIGHINFPIMMFLMKAFIVLFIVIFDRFYRPNVGVPILPFNNDTLIQAYVTVPLHF